MIRVLSALTAFLCALTFVSGCTKIKTIGGESKKDAYRRVVSLSPSSTEVASMMTYVEVIGMTASCDWPPMLKGTVIMKGVKPDYETILKMGPDAIFYDSTIIPEADLQKFKDAKIPLVSTDGGTTLKDFEDNLRKIASLTHGEYSTSKYIDQIDREVTQARVNAITPTPKVAIIMPSGGVGEHMIAGTESFSAIVVNNSGGEAVGPKGRMFVTLNAEDFIKMNPDIVVVAGEKKSLVADPRFKSMTAFTKGRLAEFAPGILFRQGMRVNVAIKNMGTSILEAMGKK